MADITIPSPNTNGYWHFTYVTVDEATGQWYGGKRSTKKHPLSDRYLGSGNWIKQHSERRRLKRKIIKFYATSTEVFAAEAKLVTWRKVFHDSLCMNQRDGGKGMSSEAALLRYTDPVEYAKQVSHLRRIHSDPVVLAKISASGLRRFEDPKERAKQTVHMRRITSNPVSLAKAKINRDTPTWRTNIITANRKKAADPEWRAKQSAIMLRIAVDPEWRARHDAIARHLGADPEHRAKIRAGIAAKKT
jgi:hypothetical protein